MVTEGPRLKSRQEAPGVEVSTVVERDDRRGWRRLRSGALLVLLLAGLGVGVAALFGALALATATLIDQALG